MNKIWRRRWKKFKFTFRKNVFTIYALLKHRMRIWHWLNRKAVSDFNNHKPKLNEHQAEIVTQLQNRGIAITSLNELFPGRDVLSELITYVEKRQDRARVNHKKPFLEDLLPEIPELGVEVPFFILATDEYMLDIINTYMGMNSMLHHFMIRRSLPARGELPSHSQNWHRAPQEKRNCRVYIYLSDVSKKDGPFCYIPESTINKKYSQVAPQTALKGGYVTSETVNSKVPPSDQMVVEGTAGTVIFCDTTGLHRGGYSQAGTRLMSTFGYGSPTLRENIHYSYPKKLQEDLSKISAATGSVLNKKWSR